MEWPTKGDRLDAPNKITQGGILDDVLQDAPMCSGHKLNATLCNASAGQSLGFCADLVHNYNLWHVILNSLNLHEQQEFPRINTLHSIDFVGCLCSTGR